MTVDLHLHTTASDGQSSPAQLVELAAAAGLTAMAVADHDTTAAVKEVQALASARGIESVAGIEITAVDNGRDVHMLGYFIDSDDEGLAAFLTAARAARISRIETIVARLDELGLPVDVEAILADARRRSGKSVGRPIIARAMIAAGHVEDIAEAFDRYLGPDGPVFVPRAGSSPEAVVAVIHAAGGLASLAHPGRTGIDSRIRGICDAGLDALEAFHSDHDAALTGRYTAMARDFGLLVTGGSDFHGDTTHGRTPGAAGLPPAEWARLSAARHRHAVR